MHGTIRRWDDDRGFGFVGSDEDGREYFLHVSAVPKDSARPSIGATIDFEVGVVDGRPRVTAMRAIPKPPKVTRPIPIRRRNRPTPAGLFSLLLIPAFFAAAAAFSPDPRWWLLYGATSVLAFVAFAIDKRAAERREWRLPESTLHAIEVLGGWPGALLGSEILRHKTTKGSYRFGFWVCVVFNIGAFFVLNTGAIGDALTVFLAA